MSPLMNRRTMDARWPWHQRSVPIGAMNAVIEVFRRVGDANTFGYDPATGGLSNTGLALLYRGQARGAANKDWRARVKTIRSDSAITHAVRFQIPQKLCPPVHAHDLLRVIDCPPDQELTHFVFHVRNMIPSSNMWVRNALCDVDVAHPNVLPPPYSMQVLAEPPAPFSGSCNCG